MSMHLRLVIRCNGCRKRASEPYRRGDRYDLQVDSLWLHLSRSGWTSDPVNPPPDGASPPRKHHCPACSRILALAAKGGLRL